ncbi:MAG: CinA family protein [Bacteroidetes bacterium]|nr:CinA family protein [Bacteroidota bacterium]
MQELFDAGLLMAIKKYFSVHHETIAVAESVSSGLLQAAFSATPGADTFYQGGITAYNLQQKLRHLQVEPVHASACNCVSEQVAMEMALHVCQLFQTDWGIGITGYATPVPESEYDLYAYYCIVRHDIVLACGRLTPGGDRSPAAVQLHYVRNLLEILEKETSKLLQI